MENEKREPLSEEQVDQIQILSSFVLQCIFMVALWEKAPFPDQIKVIIMFAWFLGGVVGAARRDVQSGIVVVILALSYLGTCALTGHSTEGVAFTAPGLVSFFLWGHLVRSYPSAFTPTEEPYDDEAGMY